MKEVTNDEEFDEIRTKNNERRYEENPLNVSQETKKFLSGRLKFADGQRIDITATERKSGVDFSKPVKVCPQCSNHFNPNPSRPKQRFCNQLCRERFWITRKKQEHKK